MSFDPITLAVGSMVMSGVGAGVSAIGQYQTAQYQSAVAKQNAEIARQNSIRQEQAGIRDAQDAGMRAQALRGKQLSAMAASGIDLGSGSAIDILDSQSALSTEDQRRVYDSSNMKAYSYKVQGKNFEDESILAERKGLYGAMTSLLGGGSSVSDKWASFKMNGVL